MIPIKNEIKGWFQVGDRDERHPTYGKIISLEWCEAVERCKEYYVNFQVCGGFKRNFEYKECFCPFKVSHIVRHLSLEAQGDPI